MFDRGDIILVDDFVDINGDYVTPHPFIVIDNKQGIIEGLCYDLETAMLTSIKSIVGEQRYSKYPENLKIEKKDGVNRDCFLKLGVIYYFDSNTIRAKKVGSISLDMLNKIDIKLAELFKQGKAISNTNNITLSNTPPTNINPPSKSI